jgi:SAM-dependent methyltransferase
MESRLPPEIYELAFSYRDYEAEVDFLELCFQTHSKTENNRVLDIACGVGEHMLQFSQRDYSVDGFDIDPDIVTYAGSKSAREAPFKVVQADMRNFKSAERYGLAINMLTSSNLLLTNKDMIAHLKAAAEALDNGGIYILEMHHPRDYGGLADIPPTTWEIQAEDLFIECDLRHQQEKLDPVSQVQRYTIRISATKDDKTEDYHLIRSYRVYLYHEFRALVELSGGFDWVACFGAFHQDRPMDSTKRSWRMIPVLRRR